MKGTYDVILGRDVLKELGIILDFQSDTVIWNESTISMKPTNCTQDISYFLTDSSRVESATERIAKILDAKYAPANLKEIADSNVKLNIHQRQKLQTLLTKYESLFDGTLGKWEGDPYNIELRENVKPYHANPYSVPHAYKHTLRMEVERLCKVGVLRKIIVQSGIHRPLSSQK